MSVLIALGHYKATVHPSIHPDTGETYTWGVPLPHAPSSVPYCPAALLEMPREEVVIGAADLNENLVIRTSDGRSMTVAEWREWMTASGTSKVGSCYVPGELRGGAEDERASGLIGLKNGSVFLHDAAAHATYWDGRRQVRSGPSQGAEGHGNDLDKSQFEIVRDRDLTVAKCLRRECRHSDSPGYLCPHVLHDEWKYARMIAIRAPIGVGKTTMIASMLQDMTARLGRPVKVLVVSYRRSLVTHSVRAFSLATDYRSVADWKTEPIENLESLGICLDSLDNGRSGKLKGRLTYTEELELKSLRWDVVILDESESIFRHLHGGTVNSPRIYKALRSILRQHTALTVLADANLSDYSVGEYRRMVGECGRNSRIIQQPVTLPLRQVTEPNGEVAWAGMEETTVAVERHQVDVLVDDRRRRSTLKDLRVARLSQVEDVEALAFKLARNNKPYYLHVTAENEARRLHKKLKQAHPGQLWPLVTGKHADADGEAFLADPNTWVLQHQGQIGGVIYTSAIESGVSIDETLAAGPDIVLVLAGGQHSTWQDLVQAVGRPREVGFIVAHVAERGRAPWWNADDYNTALAEGRAYTDKLLLESSLVDGQVQQVPCDAEHAASHVATVIHECIHRRNLGEDWWSYWMGQGYAVDDLDVLDETARKAVREVAKVERKVIKEEDADALAAADNTGMTGEQADAILDRDAKPEEQLAAHKTKLEDFFEREATKGLALFDDHGRGRAKVRALCDLSLAAEDKLEQVAAHDVGDAGRTAGRKHRALGATLTWEILRAFGVRPDHLDGTATDGTLDAADLLGLHDWLSTPSTRRVCKLGIGIDPRGYLTDGQGRRKKTRCDGTGGDLNQKNPPPVPDDLDDSPLTQDEIDFILTGPGRRPSGSARQAADCTASDGQAVPDGTGGALNQENPPPVPSLLDDTSLDGVDWDALASVQITPEQLAEARIAGHQLWGFAQQVAKRVGLRFEAAQVRSGKGRGTRTRSLDMAAVAKMLDLAAAELRRSQSARPLNGRPKSASWRAASALAPNVGHGADTEALLACERRPETAEFR